MGAQQTIELLSQRTPELVSLIKDYAFWLRELAQFGVAIADYSAPDGISFKVRLGTDCNDVKCAAWNV